MARIVIRADASLQIGSGHVMRCLTLADELRSRGAEVSFICREHPGNLCGLIEERGYPLARLAAPASDYQAATNDPLHASWLVVPWQQDAAESAAELPEQGVDWLIVDHYALDRRWEEQLRTHVIKIMVVDDLADRAHDADLLLDQNLYRDFESRYDQLVPSTCRKLLGPRYALLRPEFLEARKQLRQRDGQVQRILVFFGGVDPFNETAKAIDALAALNMHGVSVDVVVGGANPHWEQIRGLCTANGFHYHCQIINMAELMAGADLAIGAGGTATWERCALGLPSLVVVLADNQRELAQYGAQAGLCFLLGEAANLSVEDISAAVRFTLRLPDSLRHLEEQCQAMVDARGCSRVAMLLQPPQIVIRRAVLEDCDAIYTWRNAEKTRRYFFDSGSISIENHRLWYQIVINDPDRVLLIGDVDGEPVGVIRYDLHGNEALVSVYTVPGLKKHGIGTQLIRCGSSWLKRNYKQIMTIYAEIFKENHASLHAFKAAGYKEHHSIYKLLLNEIDWNY